MSVASFLTLAQRPSSLDAEPIVERLCADWGIERESTQIVPPENRQGFETMFVIGSYVVAIAVREAPADGGLFDTSVPTGRFWPVGASRPEPSHFVTVSLHDLAPNTEQPEHERLATEMFVLGGVTSELVRLVPGVLSVGFNKGNDLIDPRCFDDFHHDTEQRLFAYAVRVLVQPADGGFAAHTRGMVLYGLPELELTWSPQAEDETAGTLFGVASYLRARGPVLTPGETLSSSDGKSPALLVVDSTPIPDGDGEVLRVAFVGADGAGAGASAGADAVGREGAAGGGWSAAAGAEAGPSASDDQAPASAPTLNDETTQAPAENETPVVDPVAGEGGVGIGREDAVNQGDQALDQASSEQFTNIPVTDAAVAGSDQRQDQDSSEQFASIPVAEATGASTAGDDEADPGDAGAEQPSMGIAGADESGASEAEATPGGQGEHRSDPRSGVQTAMLLRRPDGGELSTDALVGQLERDWPELEGTISDVEQQPDGTITLRVGDRVVVIRLESGTMSEPLDELVAASRLWNPEDAVPTDATQLSLVAVARPVGGGGGVEAADAIDDASLLTRVVASVISIDRATRAIYLRGAGHVVSPRLYRDFAKSMLPEPATLLWVSVNVGGEGDGAHGFTRGLGDLGLRDLEIAPGSGLVAAGVRDVLANTAVYLTVEGPVIRDGDTIGCSERAQLVASIRPSSFGFDDEVIVLTAVPQP
ncbi:DUF4261 domain-containing protein [Gulosibacter massiliensis]|uniref:DUF4261 domain-containing protein n=1 Tax=Gulosibacter massiliensis TaxID=2479839 RepID=UPI000F62C943|nr:DUF4261 domain-containing protein [Gulosibacter massiliensis]